MLAALAVEELGSPGASFGAFRWKKWGLPVESLGAPKPPASLMASSGGRTGV